MDGVDVLAIAIVAILALVISKSNSKYETEIPRVIWTYWDDPKLPPIVQRCQDNWKRYAPEYQVNLLTRDNINTWASPPDWFYKLDKHRQSDWLRLDLVNRNGGIWMDASVILTEPIGNWVPKSGAFMFHQDGMTSNKNSPVFESWFIAASPGHPFMQEYFKDFNSICEKYGNDGKGYYEQYNSVERLKLKQNIGIPEYLTIYLSAQKMMQVDGWDHRLVQTRRSEDGPLKYQSQFAWNFDNVGKFLMGPFQGEHPMMVKLVGEDRRALDKLEKDKWPLDNTSIISRYLGPSTSSG
jgi:hypothetical protein